MRRLADRERLFRFMRELARRSPEEARVYLTGGSSAVVLEWRPTTIDVDIEVRPPSDAILQAIPALKAELEINIELASPGNFIPELPGWQERSRFIAREGRIDYFHYDFYAQALAKIERSHARDLDDVRAMHRRGLIEPPRLLELYEVIEPQLFRFPAVDPGSFRRAVGRVVRAMNG
jgi:hypothetical protein